MAHPSPGSSPTTRSTSSSRPSRVTIRPHMSAGRKLGYAAAVAFGLLAATAWAAPPAGAGPSPDSYRAVCSEPTASPSGIKTGTGKRRPRRSWGAGTEPHPLAHTVPSYTARDLADIIAIIDPHRAVAAFRQLHDDSIIELVEERSGRSHAFRFRIFGAATT